VFSQLDSPSDVEETVAQRLNHLGFIEIESPCPTSARRSLRRVQPLRSHASHTDVPRSSTDSAESERREEIEIRVELVSSASEKEQRASRLWVCEKKGKRWVERNYDEILQQLRKL
jgi:hypothetical protein